MSSFNTSTVAENLWISRKICFPSCKIGRIQQLATIHCIFVKWNINLYFASSFFNIIAYQRKNRLACIYNQNTSIPYIDCIFVFICCAASQQLSLYYMLYIHNICLSSVQPGIYFTFSYTLKFKHATHNIFPSTCLCMIVLRHSSFVILQNMHSLFIPVEKY